ncbi:MAG TPA: creatininase family protein [Planctomycetota bacterium]|nr:creatininase family protein [Planctomycetota bacterium]
MQWEKLTAPELADAARTTQTCILALGVIERHSDHLPLGTDYLVAHRIACLAAERESAVVFPPWYFGQVYNVRCFPGTVTIRPSLMLDLILAVMDEIGRNGFRKVILFNGHGGNTSMVQFLTRCTMWEEKPYSVYLPNEWLTGERKARHDAICETDLHGHACECETSISLAIHPELVKTAAVPDVPGTPQGKLKHLGDIYTGVTWTSNHPDHYAGDARPATAAKGRELLALHVDALAEHIAAVKNDTVVATISRDFFRRADDPVGD